MSLQTSNVQSTKDQVVDLRSIKLSGDGHGGVERSQFGCLLAEDRVTLSLLHLDVALAVKAQDRDAETFAGGVPCFNVFARRLTHECEDNDISVAAENCEDPVVQRLSDALAATEAADDRYSGICADALRLAILTRQFSRLSGLDRSCIAEQRGGRNAKSLQKWRLKRVLQYVDDRSAARITLQELATVAGLSRMHFAAQFRAATGMRPHQYLLKQRIERAKELLKQAEISLVDVALTVGFQTQAHFTTVFKRFAGDTPYQWRSVHLAQSAPLPIVRRRLS
jgi:AraC-like DNA-binding protein